MPHALITADDACELLLTEIPFHRDIQNTIHRGDIGEEIAYMVLPDVFRVAQDDVELTSAHTLRTRGDGGKDFLVHGKPMFTFGDVKLRKPNDGAGSYVNEHDCRSITGSLTSEEESQEGGIAILMTNHDFTSGAYDYMKKFNETNRYSNYQTLHLWNGICWRSKMKIAMKKRRHRVNGGVVAWTIKVLRHLDGKGLIELAA